MRGQAVTLSRRLYPASRELIAAGTAPLMPNKSASGPSMNLTIKAPARWKGAETINIRLPVTISLGGKSFCSLSPNGT
jgi:hypothetical protein